MKCLYKERTSRRGLICIISQIRPREIFRRVNLGGASYRYELRGNEIYNNGTHWDEPIQPPCTAFWGLIDKFPSTEKVEIL